MGYGDTLAIPGVTFIQLKLKTFTFNPWLIAQSLLLPDKRTKY